MTALRNPEGHLAFYACGVPKGQMKLNGRLSNTLGLLWVAVWTTATTIFLAMRVHWFWALPGSARVVVLVLAVFGNRSLHQTIADQQATIAAQAALLGNPT